MQQRALNVVMTAVTGSCLAGMLVAGVAAASDDAAAPKNMPSQQPLAAAQENNVLSLGQNQAAQEQSAQASLARPAKKPKKKSLLTGYTTASYFWDDGSGINGDTGAPASGRPMQKGLFASPSWPLMTKVRVTYNGRSRVGFIGDRGPGAPSHNGVMLDLDTYTFRYLLDGGKPASKYNAGTGEGHLRGVKYEVLEWGNGPGTRGEPRPL
ncbi:hypothetical protein Acsp04_47820 [Actinomadura sp. NBRC 104425]|uniref:hypothetical protein n=1 Tax=Actinomadura sp. NBRC 104425 TaxID=3032204 RepID=UPI0024A26692|nr:hypothetical protein [Actinomadura sp. NBRC 104425]GLZ14547.1 hypothetical protein Acsp04_47820 [Actinomadura sp. NBRC 104425]